MHGIFKPINLSKARIQISIVNIESQNVAVIHERNENEQPDPTPTISWTQIFNDRGPETPSDEKPKTSLASLQLPQTEEYIQTDQLCPNTE